MDLLLTVEDRKNLLLYVNTVTGVCRPVELKIKNKHTVIGGSGICYSGEWLVMGLNVSKSPYSNLLITGIHSKEIRVFDCVSIANVKSIISVYPGKIYCNTHNGVSRASFDPVNLSWFKDEIHFVLEENDRSEVCYLAENKNLWLVALTEGCIYDLTNDRVVFSNVEKPNTICFNSQNRLCFVEEDGKIVCGDDIFYVRGLIRGLIEDENEGGYWTVVHTIGKRTLSFVNYDGIVKRRIDIGQYGQSFHNIIEAKGRFIQ